MLTELTTPEKESKKLHITCTGEIAIQIEKKKHKEIVNGFGACSVSGCNCQSYMNDGTDLCRNCGHNYSMHW